MDRHPRAARLAALTLLSGAALSGTGCAVLPAGCGNPRETQYLPSQSAAVFEHDGTRVAVQRLWFSTLTVEVTSSDGRFQQTRVDPTTELYDGLELTTRMGLDWEVNPLTPPGTMSPGQVSPVLKVGSCWETVSAPADMYPSS